MNEQDIRIVNFIGAIATYKDGKQLQLNVVSIDGGELKYDLREWTVDGRPTNNGVSFDTVGAETLHAVLRDFVVSDDGNTVHEPSALPQSPATQPTRQGCDNRIHDLLQKAGISYIDKRDLGGALWVTGGHELDDLMRELKDEGYKFYFSEHGGRLTHGEPAWYLKASAGDDHRSDTTSLVINIRCSVFLLLSVENSAGCIDDGFIFSIISR